MTDREREILSIIQKEPMITQEQLASKLHIQRSSVAVHISNLIKKGKIKGKGYIIETNEPIVVIGGSNMDISGTPENKLTMRDSNIGFVKTSHGGVGRNIAENLLRLNNDVRFISAVGHDDFGKAILGDLQRLKCDLSTIMIHSELPTSTYMCINEEKGDMHVAISQMQIVKAIDTDYLNHFSPILSQAAAIVLDANLEASVMQYIAHQYANKVIFVDPVSTAKALRTVEILNYIDYFKPNILEAELILNSLGEKQIETDDIVERAKNAANKLVQYGVKHVALSIGEAGVLYASEGGIKHYPNQEVDVVNTTGAGDAFMAGWIDAVSRDLNQDDQMAYAMAAAKHNVMQNETVSKILNREVINSLL